MPRQETFISLPDGTSIPLSLYDAYVTGVSDDDLVRFLERKVTSSRHAVQKYVPERATLTRRQRVLDDEATVPLDIDIDIDLPTAPNLRDVSH